MMNPWKRPYLFPLFAIAAALLFGALVMFLWNAIIPGLAGWALITWPKAIGLLVLCRILFGGFHGRRSGHAHGCGPGWKHRAEWREKWMNMNDEQREAMRERWKHRCGTHWPKEEDKKD